MITQEAVERMRREKLHQVMNELLEEAGEKLAYMHDRWQDEREYEDFNDYVDAMKKMCEGHEFIKASKRPFGFVLRPRGLVFKMLLYADARHVGYRVVS